jgi:rhamnosyltransferase
VVKSTMSKRSTCAVVITFRPQASVLDNLAQVRPQVDGLLVVDNGSPSALLVPFHAAAGELGFELIENRANLGIAAALNLGVRWAKAQGFEFVALFDQDSTVTEGFIEAMLKEYEAHPRRDRLAIVAPRQVDRNTGRTRWYGPAADGGPLVAITSGSLMPVTIFDECGWFEEQLIIDCVDHEYCFRARSQGYTLAECRNAVLLVAVGATTHYQALGLNIHVTHHSAKRRYYITRNRLVMVQRFWKQQPGWCYRAVRDVVQDTVKLVFVEEERWSKLRNTARGIHDAFCGRMGKVVEL